MEPLVNKEHLDKLKVFYDQIHQTHIDLFHFWKENTLWHWDFWISVMLTVLPWILWFKYHRKESRYRLLLSGFFTLAISSWFDFLGVVLGAWYYHAKIIPTIPSFIPWDFSMLPVLVMTFIQTKPKVSPLLKGIVFGLLCSFIGESMFKLLGFYKELSWKSIYSFPIYVIIYLIADWLSKQRYYDEIK